jgi:ATP-binding protein involved in chromosome partitioning
MAIHVCSQCGHEDPIFGSGGGSMIARDYDTQLLGSLPLDISIRKQGDLGIPSAVSSKEEKNWAML